MTENQEEELFNILGTLVTEVRGVKSDVQEIKKTQSEHSQTLEKHSQILESHSQILEKHSQILESHSQLSVRLEGKTDTIAEIVVNNDKRLTNIEKEVEDLHGNIH